MQTNVNETMFNVILNHYNVMYNIVRVCFPTLICHFWILSKNYFEHYFETPCPGLLSTGYLLGCTQPISWLCVGVCAVCVLHVSTERERVHSHLHSCSTHTCIPADTQTMKAHNSCEDSSKLQMNVYSLTYFKLICNSQEAK